MILKKILFYQFGSNSEPGLEKILKQNKIEYCVFAKKIKDYHADAEFAFEFLQVLHAEKFQAVFSFDYFPLVSMLCEMNQIPYLSWIYDCPMYTLYSKTIGNEMNYIFCFDRKYNLYLQQLGAKHCIHFPLAADAERLVTILSNTSIDLSNEKINPKMIKDEIQKKYESDISFVGNLYSEKKNRLRNVVLSDYCKGFTDGLVESQLKVYGYNFIKEALPDDIMNEIIEKCKLSLGDMYHQDLAQMAADTVGMEVSAREREKVLRVLGEHFEVDLYSGSTLPVFLHGLNIREKGFVNYEKEMPYVFHNSKINLNITSKTIESGIPLRVFDILSCGGFCITNYQPEIAEYFTDGEDLVMYSSMEDLVEKVAYYLEHEEERKQIAQNGYEKLKRNYDLGMIIKEMLSYV
ncbi:MAG: glycosyltransferase [Lachnospiraceae bacterium]|nr:glycosyltransferase [Lachnospiraceae bacterium]